MTRSAWNWNERSERGAMHVILVFICVSGCVREDMYILLWKIVIGGTFFKVAAISLFVSQVIVSSYVTEACAYLEMVLVSCVLK